jgi:3-hydroxyacyl-CoA dehydrogenase
MTKVSEVLIVTTNTSSLAIEALMQALAGSHPLGTQTS